MDGIDITEAVTGTGEQKSGSSGSRTRKPKVEKPHEGVVTLLLELLSDDDSYQEIEVWGFKSDAEEDGKTVPEEVSETLDLPDEVGTFSWEDFFQLDLTEYKYVSYPPRNRDGDSVTYDDSYDSSNFTGDLTGETKKALNGHYADTIQEAFGSDDASAENPEVEIAIRTGRKSDHNGSFEESRKYQRFYVRSADTTPENVIKAQEFVGEITESEKEELLEGLPEEPEE